MFTELGEVVEFPLKIERVAKRGTTQTVSKRKLITRAQGRIVSIVSSGVVRIELLAYKKLRSKKWAPVANALTFVDVAMDEVDR